MKITMNKLYTFLSLFIILNLACDDDSYPTQADSTDTNLTYCLDMVNTIEGGAFDYADNNTTDQRVLTISLNSTLTDCESGSLSPVSNASILFDWIITDADGNEYDLSGSTEPHMQTIPTGTENATDIYENQSSITDENGEVKLYWVDEGLSGCIFLDCEYTDSDENIWSLSSPGSSCLSSTDGNPFEVKAVEASYSSVSFFTLNSSLDVLVYNDLPASVDSTQSLTELTLDAIVKDENGVALQYIPVHFINITPSFGTLTESSVISNSYGIAQNNLVNIVPEEIGSDLTSTITIEAKIVDETGATIQTDTKDITIIPQSLNNIFQVSNLDAVFLQSISLINNINLSYADTIVAQVLDENNTPINGVPISFNLTSLDIGYLDTQLVYTDEQGFAKSVFNISQADLADISDSNVPVSIQVFVSDNFNQTLNRTYVINGNANIEDDVNQFNFFPQTLSSMNTYAQPSNTSQGEYQGVTEFLPFIAKSSSGQGIPGVPVQFEIYESTRNSFGTLSTALAYTCCSDNASQSDSESSDEENTDDTGNSETSDNTNSGADTLYDWNGDGDATVDENMGIATVIYNNSVTGATDNIRAFILNPSDQSTYIDVSNGTNNGKEEFSITTMYSDEQASTVLLNTIPSSLNFGDNSSTSTDDGGTGGTTGGTGNETATTPDNCATIYAIAFNDQGGVLEGIPINFSMNDVANDSQYGILTEFYAVTDSIEVAPFVAAQTQFCTFENVTINMINDVNIQIDATLSNNSSVTIPSTQITITQNSSSLGLITLITDPQLPDTNSNETTPVSVTVTNQDGNTIENTLVQFESLTEDENGDLTESIGSFDPTYSFTNESGTASSTFNMGNDVGLATIITTVPEYSLADTSYISITSSDAEYIQILQPYPNEITVAGGGGLESTELTVEVKDGNGNLVSKPYLIYFVLGVNSPNETFVNVEGQTYGCIESSNGMGSVTLNSGNQPGSVPVSVALFEIGDTTCMGIEGQEPLSSAGCNSIFINPGNLYDNCELATLDAIPVTVVTGAPHSGEVNFSYVDISPIGGGLYQVPLSVELEDEWANPVQDSTNVYIWVEGFARSYDNSIDYPNVGAITDTVKWGLEINNEIDIRDSLRYVLQRPDLFNNAQNPNEMNASAINNSCDCYKNELLDSCSSDGIVTDCVWEIMPTEPGSVIGEAKTGMLSPDNAYIPGVAWSYVYFGTGDMFERVVIKALTYDSNGDILLIDSRENHQNRPLTLPFWPGTVNVSANVDAWDFGVQGAGSECYEPDWVNDGTLGDELSNGVVITTSITDYYQYPVSGGTVLLDADFSTPDEISYNYCDVAEAEEDYTDCFVPVGTQVNCSNTSATNIDDSDTAGNAHDWIACDPIDTDGDGLTGTCSNTDFNNQCSLCVGNGGQWAPDNDDTIPGSFDDDQTQCITNGNGQCFWIIHYNENVIPREEGQGGNFTYQDRISTIITTLQSPLQTSSQSIDIILEKNP